MPELVAIVLFLVIGSCIALPMYRSYRVRLKELDTLVKLAEGGADIQSVLSSLVRPHDSARSDLRKGVLLIAVALPLIVFGITERETFIVLIFGGIPLLVGLAYLAMAKSGNTTPQETQS